MSLASTRSMVASSSGWPGQTNSAKGLPGTAMRFFQRLCAHSGRVRGACADNPISVADDSRNVRGLKAFGLSLTQRSTAVLKDSLKKEAIKCGCSRLASARSISSRMANTRDASIESWARGMLLNQVAQLVPIQGIADDRVWKRSLASGLSP